MTLTAFQSQVAQLLQIDPASCLADIGEKELYAQAYALYQKEEYRKASFLFTRLVLINPFLSAHWRGLASSKQMAKDYEGALQAWALFCLLEPKAPDGHMHAAECLASSGNQEEAKKALQCASDLLSTSDSRIDHLNEVLHG